MLVLGERRGPKITPREGEGNAWKGSLDQGWRTEPSGHPSGDSTFPDTSQTWDTPEIPKLLFPGAGRSGNIHGVAFSLRECWSLTFALPPDQIPNLKSLPIHRVQPSTKAGPSRVLNPARLSLKSREFQGNEPNTHCPNV